MVLITPALAGLKATTEDQKGLLRFLFCSQQEAFSNNTIKGKS